MNAKPGSKAAESRILEPGRNCWRISPSDRIAFLRDAKCYYDALADALERAERRILVVGWDFDSSISLQPGNGSDVPLADRLRHLVETRPSLEICLLIWRGSLFYGDNGEIPNLIVGDWWRHDRIRLKFDDQHPFGACHHQKIVCIDDKIAFVGGIDLTRRRWDDHSHDPEHSDRCVDGVVYPPMHDVQALVDGRSAKDVAEVAYDRWNRAGGDTLEEIAAANDPWPLSVSPQLRGHKVAVARTSPTYADYPEIREIEALIQDALVTAQKSIYIETQYFTLEGVAQILAAHLQRAHGPEIVMAVTKRSHSPIEEYAMGQDRDRLFAYLCGQDRYGRLGLFYPVSGTAEPRCEITVHSKLFIVDDRFLRIGSSNLNNRSMGVDTECDLAIEAETPAARRAIVDLRNSLLGEHVGVAKEEFAAAFAESGSLIAAVEKFNCAEHPRCLLPCAIEDLSSIAPPSDKWLLDPSRPFDLVEIGTTLWRSDSEETRH